MKSKMKNHDYPHMSDTEFPDLQSVNVYKYENNYDYKQYGENTKIKLMNVSWCGDYDNTVYFETKEERDEWFDMQEGMVKELPSMFRLYSNGSIKIPLTIDEAMNYNYVMIDYGKLPSQYELSDNHRMYYFINNMVQASPNATELNVSVDYWTTYINDMNIEYVNLVRGHAPMSSISVEEYLSNPLDNSEYLLTNDVNYGDLQRAASTDSVILNDSDVVLGFLTNGNLDNVSWHWNIPTEAFYTGNSQAVSAIDTYTLELRDFDGFRDKVTEIYPQFWVTVKGMFLIPRKLIRETSTFDFLGYTMHHIDTNGDKLISEYKITKDKFGYPDKLDKIAKLYTFPYAAIEVNDFKGNTSIIKVEDTVGTLELHTIMCDMYPFLNVEAYMLGLGGNTRTTIRFVNNTQNTFNIGGRYYNFSTKWNIPVFAVQLTTEANWRINKQIGADASLANTKAIAQQHRDNAALNISTNELNTAAGNLLAQNNKNVTNLLMTNQTSITNAATIASVNAGISAAEAQVTVSNNAATSIASVGVASSIASGAISGAGSGEIMGVALGAVAGAVSGYTGMINNSTQCQANYQGVQIANGLKLTDAQINTDANRQSIWLSIDANNSSYDYQIAYNNAMLENGNNLIAATTNNSATTTENNAIRAYNASHDQTMLTNPPEFGQLTGTPDIISKPFGITYNVITESKNAIRQAGEQFLRYGYMLNMEWLVESFNLMPKFTYWQCDAVYLDDNGVYEGAQDVIKSILMKGTTVWRNPEEIGVTSIYKNI